MNAPGLSLDEITKLPLRAQRREWRKIVKPIRDFLEEIDPGAWVYRYRFLISSAVILGTLALAGAWAWMGS